MGEETVRQTVAPRDTAPRFWRDNLWLNGGGVVAGLSNVGYHVIVARMLGPLNYGVLQGLGALAVVVQAGVSLVTLVYTRRGAKPSEFLRLNGMWLLAGGALYGVLVLFAGSLASLFRLPRPALEIFMLVLVTSLLAGANVGLIQWAAEFLWAGALTALAAVGRLVGAVAAAVTRAGLAGLVIATPAIGVLTASGAFWAARLSVARGARSGLRSHGGLLNAGIVGSVTLLLTSADVLAAKHSLTGTAAGLYSGLTTMGRAPTYFAGAVGTVLLSATQRDPGRGRPYLWRSLVLVTGLAAMGLGIYRLRGTWLIRLALGARFLPLAPHLLLFSTAMALQSVEIVLLYYAAARNWPVVTVVGVIGFLGWMGIVWTTPVLGVLIGRTVWAMALQLAGTAVATAWAERHTRPDSKPHTAPARP